MLTKQGVRDLSALGSSSASPKKNYAHQLCEHRWYYEDHGQLGKTRECINPGCGLFEELLAGVYRPPWIKQNAEGEKVNATHEDADRNANRTTRGMRLSSTI